jgi:5-methylcytosine-specific restriction endonuclease McrA
MKRSPLLRGTKPMTRKSMPHVRIPASVRLYVLNRDDWHCQYGDCLKAPSTIDHIVPKGDRRRAGIGDLDAEYMAACCHDHNILKGSRRLCPPSWADRLSALNERTGREYRVWLGTTMEPAFREVHR